MIEIYEGVFYREIFKRPPFRNVIEKLLAVRQKYKDEGFDLVQGFLMLQMNSLCGIQIQKSFNRF